MKNLSYETLKELNYEGYLLEDAPERVLQFGEGNFLRAFAEYFVDQMNERAGFNSKVVLVQPNASTAKRADMLNGQDGLYTLYTRGFENGCKVNNKRVISCVSRCINARQNYEAFLDCAKNPELRFLVSNTTEAGIVYDPQCRFEDAPASAFPAKLTRFLYERFLNFGDTEGKGFIILPCELIDHNGYELKKCVKNYTAQWNLGDTFAAWVEKENIFCSTLVDRIVTGYPQEEAEALHADNGYVDEMIDTGEVFAFWAIEGPQCVKEELPFEKAGLPVILTDDVTPYKQRKVRILNGAHTSMVLGAYLAGKDIVRSCMEDDVIRGFMNAVVYNEVIPTLDLPEKELRSFADAVSERFNNPFIDHSLLAISLNSTSKWKARVLPTLKEYVKRYNKLPECVTASFAFYIAFYRGLELTEEGLVGRRGGHEYRIKDDRNILEFYEAHKDDTAEGLAHAVCTSELLWDEDLSLIPGFESTVADCLKAIEEKGCYEVMKAKIEAA